MNSLKRSLQFVLFLTLLLIVGTLTAATYEEKSGSTRGSSVSYPASVGYDWAESRRITIRGVLVNGAGINEPVAPGTEVRLDIAWAIEASGSNIQQIVVGFAENDKPTHCIHSSTGSHTGESEIYLKAPSTPGPHAVAYDLRLQYTCEAALSYNWTGIESKYDKHMAVVAVQEEAPGWSGFPVSLGYNIVFVPNGFVYNILVNGGSISAPVAPGSDVNITLAWNIGSPGQIVVGFADLAKPTHCINIIQVPSFGATNVTLSAPPTPGPHVVIVGRQFQSNCTNALNLAWPSGSEAATEMYMAVVNVQDTSPRWQAFPATFGYTRAASERARLTNVKVNNGSVTAPIQPGSEVEVAFDWTVENPVAQQIVLGFTEFGRPSQCIQTPQGVTTGSSSLTFTAPMSRGPQILAFGHHIQPHCGVALALGWNGMPFDSSPLSMAVVQIPGSQLYIPFIAHQFCGGYLGPAEAESNDDYPIANGPLCFGYSYTGQPDEGGWDYYYVNWDGQGTLSIDVTGLPAHQQVSLTSATDPHTSIIRDYDPDYDGNYHIEYVGPQTAGIYYVRVYSAVAGVGDYTLTVADD